MINFQSIKTRLNFWFLTITIILLAIVLLIIYFQRVNFINVENRNRLVALRNHTMLQINNWLHEREADMVVIASDIGWHLHSSKKTTSNDLNYLNTELNQIAESYRGYIDVFVLDASNGKVLFASDSQIIGSDMKDKDFYLNVIKNPGLVITDVYYSEILDQYTMAYSIPIWTDNKKDSFNKILIARIDLNNSLYQIVSNISGLKKSGETLIVNAKGYPISNLRYYKDAQLKLLITAEPAVRAYSGNTGITIADDYRGETVLAAYSYFPSTNWGIICKEDLNELNEPLNQLLITITVIFLSSVTILFLISYFLSRKLVSELIYLNDASKKIAEGNLKVRYKGKGYDEIANLGNEFNRMADAVENRIKTLNGITSISKAIISTNTHEEFGRAIIYCVNQLNNLVYGGLFKYSVDKNSLELVTSIDQFSDYTNYLKVSKPGEIINNATSLMSIYHKQVKYLSRVFDDYDISPDKQIYDLLIVPIIIDNEINGSLVFIVKEKFNDAIIDSLIKSWELINLAYDNISNTNTLKNMSSYLEKTNRELESRTRDLEKQTDLLNLQTTKLLNTTNDLVKKNELLDNQKKQLQQLSQLKSEFISTMSHELKTPLNSILSLSGVLCNGSNENLSELEQNYLTIIHRNGKNLFKLIEDILELSKIEAGKLKPNISKFSLKSLLISNIESITSLATTKGVEVYTIVPDDIPSIRSDEIRIFQIINNVISNAIKFTSRGFVAIRVEIQNSKIKIEVEDTGIGIRAEDIPHIFDEFRQVDSSFSRGYEGTGLGLAIAKKNADILGVDIEVTSKPKKGSTFTIYIPIVYKPVDKEEDN